MSGNAWEWCYDWYDNNYYSVSTVDNPTGPQSGILKVIRGGGFNNLSKSCRVSNRNYHRVDSYDINIGFRIVKTDIR